MHVTPSQGDARNPQKLASVGCISVVANVVPLPSRSSEAQYVLLDFDDLINTAFYKRP